MELTVKKENITSNVEDLSKFVLIGRDKLTAVRAAIRAIDKVGVASEVYRQKLAEGQDVAEAVLDAEVRLGELRKKVQRGQGLRTDKLVPTVGNKFTPLQNFDSKTQLKSSDANRLETMAAHTDIVERVKAEARENGELVTRQAVLNAIKKERKETEIEKAKESISVQSESNTAKPALFIGDSVGYKTEEKVDLLLTDPPYSTDVDDIEAFANRWLPSALCNVKDTGFAYVFIGAYPEELKAYLNVKVPEHMRLEQILCWTYKNTLGNNPKDRYKLNYQNILFFRGIHAPALDCPLTSEQWTVQEINAPDGRLGSRYHKWQKPMEIAERFIRHSTKPGMTVYDPFACTGTFLLAASKLGRKSIGIEVDEDNAKIAFGGGCVYGGRL